MLINHVFHDSERFPCVWMYLVELVKLAQLVIS